MVDRLAEIKLFLLEKSKKHVEIDITEAVSGCWLNELDECYHLAEIIKSNIVELLNKVTRLNSVYKSLQAESKDDNTNYSQRIDEIISTGNIHAKTAKELLTDLTTECQKYERLHDSTDSTLRVRKNLVATLTKKYVDTLRDYQNIQNLIREYKIKKISKQILKLKPDATYEEILDLIHQNPQSIENDEISGSLKNRILASLRHHNIIKQSYDKYKEILLLESSVTQLTVLCSDFALVLEQQGDLLLNIENQVNATTWYIDLGNEELQVANTELIKYQTNYCMINILVLLIVILAVFIIVSAIVGTKVIHI